MNNWTTDLYVITHIRLCVNPSIHPLVCIPAGMHMPLWLTRLFVAFLWPEKANAAYVITSTRLSTSLREIILSSQRKIPVCRSVEQMKKEGERRWWRRAFTPVLVLLLLSLSLSSSLSHTNIWRESSQIILKSMHHNYATSLNWRLETGRRRIE